jgi:glycosyltransferase involved in cell wall biosynthesis
MINKKIIHIITTIERGGAENQLLILAKEQIDQGFLVEVIYLKGKPDLKNDFESLGISVNDQIVDKKFISQIKFLKKYFTNNNCLVHTHLPRSEVLAFLTLSKNRYLITRHNYEAFWPSMPKLISSLLSRLVSSKAAGGIAISEALKKYLINNLEIAKNFPFEVVYYGFSTKPELSIHEHVCRLTINNLPIDSFKIGIISRLVPGKDYQTLFRAFNLVLKKHSDARLLVVGDGYQKNYLFDMSNKMGLANNIIWLGKIDYISDFLSVLDLFVFTSKGEGFGLVILEAMMASKPILASNNSAIPEILGKNYQGLFETGNHLELAEKIIKAIEYKDYSKELVNSYLLQIELFNPKAMADSIHQIYERYGF